MPVIYDVCGNACLLASIASLGAREIFFTVNEKTARKRFSGGAEGIRTPDLLIANQPL